MIDPNPKRHWFRFSLRTLFVLVTIFGVGAGWVAYQLNWVRERHKFLRTLAGDAKERSSFLRSEVPHLYPQPKRTLPIVARIIGEQPYSLIILPQSYNQMLIEEARSLFPESIIDQVSKDSIIDGRGRTHQVTIGVTKY
jgi:hypothetical protein